MGPYYLNDFELLVIWQSFTRKTEYGLEYINDFNIIQILMYRYLATALNILNFHKIKFWNSEATDWTQPTESNFKCIVTIFKIMYVCFELFNFFLQTITF